MDMRHFTFVLMAVATFCSQSFAQQRVRNIYTSSPTLNVSALQNQESPARLCRTLFAGYNSICLPVSLDAEQLQEAAPGTQVERLAAVKQEGSTLNLYFLDCTAEGIEAGQPYLIFSPKLQTLRTAPECSVDTELKHVTMSDKEGNQVTFGSSWESLKVEGRYGIPAQQDTYVLESILVRTEADKVFLPTRCGFTWDSQSATATQLEIKHVTSLEGMATSIASLEANGAAVDVYDITGTLVKSNTNINDALNSLATGMYIIGGQKVAVK